MVDPIPNSVKAVWARCNVEACIMLSLSVQGLLIFAASFRKRNSRRWVTFLVWFTYLLADFIALVTVGLISNRQGNNLTNLGSKRDTSTSASATSNSGDIGYLYALWAPFCLLHLGGPDTITAFSLQDNSLWLRHLAGLIIQVVVVVYTFIESLPENKLWLPISFLLVVGLIKYAERTRALYLANLESFRANPGPNYAKLMGEFSWKRAARIPALIRMVPRRERSFAVPPQHSDDVTAVQHAHHFFLKFMNLIVDQLVLFSSDLNESQQYFSRITSTDALKVLSVELNFFYEVLYTKALVVHRKSGYFFRFMSSAAIVVALSLFLKAEKQSFNSTDVKVTYVLFGGAIGLDVVAFLMFVSSDWTIIALREKLKRHPSLLKWAFNKYLKLKSSDLSQVSSQSKLEKLLVRTQKALFRRWSESVSSCTFFDYCLGDLPNVNVNMMVRYWRTFYVRVIRILGLEEILDKNKYVRRRRLGKDLWNFIFEVLKRNAKFTSTDDRKMAKIMSSNIHDWISMYVELANYDTIRSYLAEIDYDRSLLLWHIATELVYETEKTEHVDRDTSKMLSDYMLYLTQMQPTLMSSVAGIAKKSFEDTCAEAHRFFSRIGAGVSLSSEEACQRILEVHTDHYKPADVKGGKSKSVLFDACILAKELKKMMDQREKMWEFLSQVWVGMLSYAACRCRPAPHLELLGKGGELITHVWLLMAHFGIGKQLYVTDEHATAKLIVDL